MTLDQLRCFLAVARVGNFTRAADGIGIAQPSLSRQIATLERDLGVQLFDRTRGATSLTVAGDTLLPVATRMIEDRATAYRRIQELTGLTRGRLRIGATPSLCMSVVSDALGRFRDANPGVELHVSEAGSRTLSQCLVQGELDLALVVTDQVNRNPVLDVASLAREELVVVSSADRQPLTARNAITLEELADQPLVLCHDGYDLRLAVDRAFASSGLRPNVVVEGAELGAVLGFVSRGIGATIAPVTATLHFSGLRATRLVSPELHRTIGLACRVDLAPSHAAVAFHSILQDSVSALAEVSAGLSPALPEGHGGDLSVLG